MKMKRGSLLKYPVNQLIQIILQLIFNTLSNNLILGMKGLKLSGFIRNKPVFNHQRIN